jgi:hypothetical protein
VAPNVCLCSGFALGRRSQRSPEDPIAHKRAMGTSSGDSGQSWIGSVSEFRATIGPNSLPQAWPGDRKDNWPEDLYPHANLFHSLAEGRCSTPCSGL